MNTLDQILKKKPVYLNDWKDKIDLIGDFDDIFMSSEEYNAKESSYPNKEMWAQNKQKMKEAIQRWKPINILFASYGYENYSGDAFVLFEQNGELFEVNGGHCSCYGLEGQWNPEPTTLEAIKHRLIEGRLGDDVYSGNQFKNELMKFLGIKTTTHDPHRNHCRL